MRGLSWPVPRHGPALEGVEAAPTSGRTVDLYTPMEYTGPHTGTTRSDATLEPGSTEDSDGQAPANGRDRPLGRDAG